jgi:hypothetical protein
VEAETGFFSAITSMVVDFVLNVVWAREMIDASTNV